MNEDIGLYVVIPVLNRWEQTARCLERLLAERQPADRIIVVDHGSSDGTSASLARDFPAIVRLADDPNHWWTGATNSGVRIVLERGARFIMLLNNDCRLSPGTLERMRAHIRQRPDAIVTPVQRDDAGRILVARAGTCLLLGFPTVIAPWHRRLHEADTLLPTRLIVGGRGTIIPAPVFLTIGLFDDAALPHYGADHDFYLRCRRHGIPLLVAADCSVIVGGSTEDPSRSLGGTSWREFGESLRGRRSHRNITDIGTLLRHHYPVRGLYWLGTGLFLGRYFLRYLYDRLRHTLRYAWTKLFSAGPE